MQFSCRIIRLSCLFVKRKRMKNVVQYEYHIEINTKKKGKQQILVQVVEVNSLK